VPRHLCHRCERLLRALQAELMASRGGGGGGAGGSSSDDDALLLAALLDDEVRRSSFVFYSSFVSFFRFRAVARRRGATRSIVCHDDA
jgi:hypothetical protein